MNFLFEEYPISAQTVLLVNEQRQYAYYCLADAFAFLGAKSIADPMQLAPYFKYSKVEKDTVITPIDIVPDKLYFIIKGAIKNHLNSNGIDKIVLLLTEGNFITSFDSFITQSASKSIVTTVEDTILLEITYKDYVRIKEDLPELNSALEQALIRFMRFLTEMSIIMKMESKQRYNFLVSKMPQIPNRFQLQHQASMLGMKPETLSRIRNEIAHKPL